VDPAMPLALQLIRIDLTSAEIMHYASKATKAELKLD